MYHNIKYTGYELDILYRRKVYDNEKLWENVIVGIERERERERERESIVLLEGS
jgi:hypothetical protein